MYPVADHPQSPYLAKQHHGSRSFKNPTGSAHLKDGRHSAAMLSLMAELAVSGNRPFSYPEDHVLSRRVALDSLRDGYQEDAITWLGQACFFMKIGNVSVLTDPFLSLRASPLPFSGPKRLVPAPLQIGDLPTLDVIVISHNHYDHLDKKTLSNWHNKTTPVITTIGTGDVIRRLGYNQVIELDWYQSVEVKGAVFTCLPAYHFSGRSLTDSNRALWGSFHIQCKGRSVFFAGDTGYGSEFTRIGEIMGPVDLALVPIGAYAPRDIMAKVHASPEEGVAIGRDVGAGMLIPMHWGTIRLTNEPMMEPKHRFEAAIQQQSGANKTPGQVFSIGETRRFSELGSHRLTID